VSTWQRIHEEHMMQMKYSEIMGKPAESLKSESVWISSSI
jgi:hypothetical protein